MDNIKLYGSIQKKNDEQQTVEGFASAEVVDSQGEIVKITAIEKALPDYMKYANIREMHQWSAVGKTIKAVVDMQKKGLYIVAKIVDPIAWAKVKEGVYNGFSIGGRVMKRINNVIEELALNEISLVDRPANPAAVFSLIKMEVPTPDAPTAMESDANSEEGMHIGVQVADRLIATCADLVRMQQMLGEIGRTNRYIESAIQQLKRAAVLEIRTDKAEKGQFIDPSWEKEYFDALKKTL